jgi:hypothetical protein
MKRHSRLLPLALLPSMSLALVHAAEVPDPNAVKEAATVAKAKAEEAVADKHYKVPRTAYGQPDLEGVWTNVSITPLERPSQFGNSIAQLVHHQHAERPDSGLQSWLQERKHADAR